MTLLPTAHRPLLHATCFHDHPEVRPPVDERRLAAAVREMLIALGENPDREGLVETPKRVARAFRELVQGHHESAADHLARRFEHEGEDGDVVILRNIEFASTCEHHLQPFLGRAHIAYLPDGRFVTGLSKLARTVDVFARRLQLQERMTSQIADALMTHLGARGAAVVVEGEHLCMRSRGAKKRDAMMVTTAFRGVYRDDKELRREVLALLRGR